MLPWSVLERPLCPFCYAPYGYKTGHSAARPRAAGESACISSPAGTRSSFNGDRESTQPHHGACRKSGAARAYACLVVCFGRAAFGGDGGRSVTQSVFFQDGHSSAFRAERSMRSQYDFAVAELLLSIFIRRPPWNCIANCQARRDFSFDVRIRAHGHARQRRFARPGRLVHTCVVLPSDGAPGADL